MFKHISLREALKCTAAGGQGFGKRNYEAFQKKCSNLKCKCFKAQLKCNSRSHNSLSCSNK